MKFISENKKASFHVKRLSKKVASNCYTYDCLLCNGTLSEGVNSVPLSVDLNN